MKATDILWDVDNEEELESLPKEVDIPVELTDEEEISDYLSELTGYCHCGFSLSSDSLPEKNKANDGKKESKSDRFRRVAEARVNKIIKMVRLLGNCSNPAVYAFTGEQVQQIFATLKDALDKAQKRYTQSYKERFSLSEKQSAALTEIPTIVLPLPDGSRLRAVAYGGDSFPAINIYWDTGLHDIDGPICFAEYNPERSPCHEVCIGAYQSDKDDTIYYRPYMAERDSDEED